MKPSVLHVLSSLKLGGAEKFTIELAQLQRRQGHDARILSLGEDSEFLKQVALHGDVPVIVCSSLSSRLDRYRQLTALFRQFDVVQIHSPRILSYLAPAIMLNPTRKYIYTRHGLDPLQGFKWRVIHSLLRPFINRVTFVTQTGLDTFKRSFQWPDANLQVIENGVNIPDQPASFRGPVVRFGSVGRMVALKGQKHLLSSAGMLVQRLPQANFEIHFFGTGPEEAALQSMATALPAGKVVFHGQVQDIAEIYRNIDVLVVTSETEGLSMVIIEAMAKGLPVIATRVGGNPSLVFDGTTGLLFDFADQDALCQHMEKFLAAPELINAYGGNARAMISSRFSLERTSAAYLAVYQS